MSRTTDAKQDARVSIGVSLTLPQLEEINRRADLEPFDGKARSEYMVGCLFREPHDELLERVRAVRDVERGRFRSEIAVERARGLQHRRLASTRGAPHGGEEHGAALYASWPAPATSS